MSDRHVVPADDGWHVEKNDAQRPSTTAPTQAEAIKRAVEIVAHDGGGQVVVHGTDGQIRENQTVARDEEHTTRVAAALAASAALEGAEVTGRGAADEAAEVADEVGDQARDAAGRSAAHTRTGAAHAAATAEAGAAGVGEQVNAVAYGDKSLRAGGRDIATIAETTGEQIADQAEHTARQVRGDTRAAADRAASAGAGIGDELDTAAHRAGQRIHTATETLAGPLDGVTDRALEQVGRVTHALNPVRLAGRGVGVVIAGGLHLASVLAVRGTRSARSGVHAATDRTTTDRTTAGQRR